MITEELVQRSPVRIFEKSIKGGLVAGEIGVIVAPSGIGKTSVLVQLGLDKLLQEKKIIHVSFTQQTDYVLAWYENIFEELFKKRKLDSKSLKSELVKNRVLMNFPQESVTSDQINRSLRSLIVDGGFKAESIIVDGLDFTRADRERFSTTRQFAAELGLTVWYSCNAKEAGIPPFMKGYLDLLDVVAVLEPKPDHITLSIAKDHGTPNPHSSMRLDPKTLLILEG
ncbi:MAG: hypothetical protein LBS86_04650 [Treponema sp.]|jgi:hypothetical protein|nr:hypothetical protein [Treponema sp.]